MRRVSRKNRNRHLRHLAALAAVGLISFNCASPALGAGDCSPEGDPGNQTICSNGPVTPGNDPYEAGGGLGIEGGHDDQGEPVETVATWNVSPGGSTVISDEDKKIIGVAFQDGGPDSGDATLDLNGNGTFIIGEGGIRNENINSNSEININDSGSKLIIGNVDSVADDDIVGNEQKTLTIKSNNSTLDARNSNVTGKVDFIATGDNDSPGYDGSSTFTVGSIGEKGTKLTVVSTGNTKDTGSVKLIVTEIVDKATLNLGDVTKANITSIGEWIDKDKYTVNTVNIFGNSSLIVTKAEGTLNVVNKTGYDKAAIINQLGNGILNVGGGNVNVDAIAAGADVSIGSVQNPDNNLGQVTLDVAGILPDNGGANTHIDLKNAILKITDNDATTNNSYGLEGLKAGEFTMNSTDGNSHLMSDTGDTLQIDSGLAPTVTVGAGGNAIIESDHLEYDNVLKSSDGATTGAVYFVDNDLETPDVLDNDNKMIFKSSNNTNNFNKGVQIAAGNWEFEGSTTITAQVGDYIQDSDIYFTGNSDDPAASTFTIDGNIIEMKKKNSGTTLHLNENIKISYTGPGSLENLDTLKLGDTVANTNLSFGADTILKVAQIDTGYYDDSSGGAVRMAATVEDIFIGKLSDSPKHPDGTTAITFSSGLQGEHITLNDTVKVTGGLYIDKNGTASVIEIGHGEGGFLFTDQTAQDSYAEDGAVVELSKDAYLDGLTGKTQTIQLFGKDSSATDEGLDGLIAKMIGSVKVESSDLEEWLNSIGSTLKVVIDNDGSVTYKAVDENAVPAPSFARPMVDVLLAGGDPKLEKLGLHLMTQDDFASSDAYNRELVQVMGNTMNSSLMLVQNGATQAFGRLNATAPTLTGYKTVQAVAAPRRAATVQAPSAAIGVPIRANDAPSIAVQPQPGAAAVPPAPIAPASGSDDGRAHGFWITPNFIRMAMDDNYSEGYSGFDVKSMGMIMGYDQWVNENARLGAFLSYNNPKLDNDNQEISADDFQVGVYAQGVMPNGIILNGALAMGRQDYSSTRNVRISDPGLAQQFNEELKADYSGKTFGAAIEASRPVDLGNNLYIRPSAGYSYQNISLDDIEEETNKAFSLAQKISSDTFNIQQARLGTDIGWVNPDNTLTVTGKAYLVANMGDTQPEGTASFITAANSNTFKVQGAELDDNMVNLGLGLKFTPAGTEGMVISLDYDAMFGSNTQSHNLGLMLRYEF